MLCVLSCSVTVPAIYISSATNRIITITHGLGSAFQEEGGEVLASGQVGGGLYVPTRHLHLVQHVADQRMYLQWKDRVKS